MEDNNYNPNEGFSFLISCSEIKPPKKKCDKAKEGVPSVTMRKIPPSSPIQPPTKPSGRGSRKK